MIQTPCRVAPVPLKPVDLVISASLSPTSRSRVLATEAAGRLREAGRGVELLDLRETVLPLCDGGPAYGHPDAVRAAQLVAAARCVLLAAPVYNYDVNAAAKNLVELTGRAWEGKIVGLLLSAGGRAGYMSATGLANSLMLDFRCHIVPRFVYATEAAVEGDRIVDEEVARRVRELADETARVADALAK